MTPKNAIAGFKATGIFRCDTLKYQTERFDKSLMKKFDAWIKAGKPEKRVNALEETVKTEEEMLNDDEFDITSIATSSSTSNLSSELNLPLASTPAVHQPPPVQPDSTTFMQPSDILVIPPVP